jgi:hypothetical protein
MQLSLSADFGQMLAMLMPESLSQDGLRFHLSTLFCVLDRSSGGEVSAREVKYALALLW